jgi:hypothetical protein
MELEQLQDELTEQLLCNLKIEQLKEVCIQAKVSPEGKKHTLIRAINGSEDKALEDDEHKVAETFVQDLLATAKQLSETAPKPDGDEKHNEELQRLRKQYAEMQLNFQKSTKLLEEEMSRLTEKIHRTSSSPVEPPFPKAP